MYKQWVNFKWSLKNQGIESMLSSFGKSKQKLLKEMNYKETSYTGYLALIGECWNESV